ncbi:MAG: LytTR family DNA-binding domain-containing protein [Clostridia bacterium]
MNLSVGICDDEISQTEYIKKLVSVWVKEQNFSAQIKVFSSAENFLFEYEDCTNFDILLLDIEMDKINGVELAKEIRKKDETVQIIFITGYSEYIAEGYEVSALHYLMKPLNENKLFETLDRAVEKISKNEKTLLVETKDQTAKIPLYQIKYIDVQQNYITIHGAENYVIKKTLGSIEKELDDRFFRAGRSCIVNLNYINRVTKTDIILSNSEKIPLPKGMYDKINRAIIEVS